MKISGNLPAENTVIDQLISRLDNPRLAIPLRYLFADWCNLEIFELVDSLGYKETAKSFLGVSNTMQGQKIFYMARTMKRCPG